MKLQLELMECNWQDNIYLGCKLLQYWWFWKINESGYVVFQIIIDLFNTVMNYLNSNKI